jgi:hypothetical protein
MTPEWVTTTNPAPPVTTVSSHSTDSIKRLSLDFGTASATVILLEHPHQTRNTVPCLKSQNQNSEITTMSFKITVKVKVVNQLTGAVEDSSRHSVADLSAGEVSAMRSDLIKVTEGWNAAGVDGQGAAPAPAK